MRHPIARLSPPALAVLLGGALFLLASSARAAAPDPAFGVAPPADWVKPLPLPATTEAPTNVAAGTLFLLSDEQVRVTGKTMQRYIHQARKVLSAGGVDEASSLHIEFEPSYQKLTLHGVWRIRDGQRQDVLRPAEVKVLQQESEFQLRLYNGMLSVVPILHDVRVGDVIEFAYTREGLNPVFDGKVSGAFSTSSDVPIVLWRERLLWPENRPLYLRSHGADPGHSESVVAGVRELVWARQNVSPVQGEDGVPAWYDAYSWIQMSEYETWGEVARWATRLFQVPTRSEALEQEVRRLAKEPTPQARFVAALRFVQDEVRYLGIELGPNSHRPFPPAEVLARRFGDCKDKSLLLVTLLQGLGIEARPALVSSYLQHGLDSWHPSPHAFDHAIVRATVDGHEYWVDPTRTFERGTLGRYQPPDFARALVVDPGTVELVEIPHPRLDEPSYFVEESYDASRRSGPVHLRIVTTRTGRDADRMRAELATTPLADVARSYLNHYAKEDPKIRVGTPMTVEDDEERDVLITREHYVIDDFWTDGAERGFAATAIDSRLWEPGITQRTLPLRVSHPVNVRHRITLNAPEVISIQAEHPQVQGPAFRTDFEFDSTGSTVVLDYRYRSLADEVAPTRVQEHLTAIRRVRDLLGYRITLGSHSSSSESELGAGGWLCMALALMGGLALFGLQRGPVALWRDLRLRLRRRAFTRKFADSAGDTAQSAIPVSGAAELLAALGKLRCACGAAGPETTESLRHEAIIFGDRHLTLVQWRCPKCARERRAYFEDKTARAA